MSPRDFHQGGQGDWDMALAGMPDMNQDEPYVRDQLFAWLRWLDDQTGVDGYRIDAVKHMPPGFTEGLLWQVQEGQGQQRFCVGEYYDGNPHTLAWWTHAVQGRSGVFDFTLFFQLLSMAHGGGSFDMRGLRWHVFDDFRRVTFVNNHDTFRRGNGLHLWQRADLAYAFIMAATGYPSVYWEDLFDPTGAARGWLVNLMWIHTNYAHGAMLERWADHDLYVFERQGSLLTGLNDAPGYWRSEWVRTEFGPNVRLHDYSGHAGDVWTNAQGWVQLAVPPGGYVMYAPAGQEGPAAQAPARRTRQQWEAAADLDLRPAGEWWGDPVPFVGAQGEPIEVDLWLEDPAAVAHVALFDAQGNRLNHARGQGHVRLEYRSPPADGWYQLRVGLEQTGQGRRSDYWLEVDYQGPAANPGAPPTTGTWDLLPLVPASVGP
jgi:alpha-amylase